MSTSTPQPLASLSAPSQSHHPHPHILHNRRRAPTTDPFLSLTEPAPAPASPPEEAADESWFTKLILIPLTTISFILSLTFIDFRARSYRAAEHDAAGRRFSLERWVNPQPYGSGAESSSGNTDGSSEGTDGSGKAGSGKGWFVGKKHRAVAKMEMGDAWELRAGVMALLVLGVLAVVGLGVMLLSRLWVWWTAVR